MKITSQALDHIIEEHLHESSNVYPTLAAGVAVTGGAAWVLGAFVQIMPASTASDRFDIHFVSIEDLDTNAVYELVLYHGAGDTEYARTRFTKNAVQDGVMNVPIQGPIIAPTERIRAKLADSSGGSVATISLFYHVY